MQYGHLLLWCSSGEYTNLCMCTSIELKLLFGSHVCSSSTFYSIAVTLIVLYTKKPSDDGNDTTSTTTTELTIVTVEPTATAKPTAPPTAPPTLPAGKTLQIKGDLARLF